MNFLIIFFIIKQNLILDSQYNNGTHKQTNFQSYFNLLIIIQLINSQIRIQMSWPFHFNFDQTNQFMGNFPHFNNVYDPNIYCPNPCNNEIQNPHFIFSQNYVPFPPICQPPSIPNFYSASNLTQHQNLNRNSVSIRPQNYQKIQKSIENDSSIQKSESPRLQQADDRLVRFRRRRAFKKPKNQISHNSSLRNDTKNIPKNYGKAMLSYIQKNTRQAKELLSALQVDTLQFMMMVKSFKSKINTIHDLRQMWGQNQNQNKIKKCIRILSYHFMRKKCLPYIFNSRVKNYHTHIKYRKKIMQGIENPQNFTKIKQF